MIPKGAHIISANALVVPLLFHLVH